jgi:hypothetical protein
MVIPIEQLAEAVDQTIKGFINGLVRQKKKGVEVDPLDVKLDFQFQIVLKNGLNAITRTKLSGANKSVSTRVDAPTTTTRIDDPTSSTQSRETEKTTQISKMGEQVSTEETEASTDGQTKASQNNGTTIATNIEYQQ